MAMAATLLHALCVEPQRDGDMQKALEIAKKLLDKHCSIDALDHEGITSLHHCVVNNEPELAELLLEYGANPNALIPDSWVSPLMIAALEKKHKTQSSAHPVRGRTQPSNTRWHHSVSDISGNAAIRLEKTKTRCTARRHRLTTSCYDIHP